MKNIEAEGLGAADGGFGRQFWIGRVIGDNAKAQQIQHDYTAGDTAADEVFASSLRWFEMANKFARGHGASFQLC
jgi:hypothetical protein